MSRELRYFRMLDELSQRAAVHRMGAAGMGPHTISTITGLHPAMVARWLREHGIPATVHAQQEQRP